MGNKRSSVLWFKLNQQQSLRLLMSYNCLLFLFFTTQAIANPVFLSFFIVYFFVLHIYFNKHGKNIRNWWFLWRGPFLASYFNIGGISDIEDINRLIHAEIWLIENVPKENWRFIHHCPYVSIKFRHKRDAILFRLSCD
jgi:hypothetical protein